MVSIKGNPVLVPSDCRRLSSDGASPRPRRPVQSQSDGRRRPSDGTTESTDPEIVDYTSKYGSVGNLSHGRALIFSVP